MSPLPVGPSPRDRTRHDLFGLIREHHGLTRAELVELTGLSRSTVNYAVAALIGQGRVAEVEFEQKGPGSGSGRPANRLTATADGALVAGVDFGHNHVHVAIADGAGVMLTEQRIEFDVDQRARDAIDAAADLLGRLLDGLGQDRDGVPSALDSVVAGIPGPVDRRTGRVQSPTILSGWVGLAPAQEIADRIGVAVRVENDAVLGAAGELAAGAGRSLRDFLYVKASHGIGASLVIDGRIYTGSTGLAGEIGHTRLPGRMEVCRCGNRGCLETVVSIDALREHIGHTRPATEALTVDLATLDDAVSLRILSRSGRTLGAALAELCNLLNPAAVIVGGELGSIGGAFIQGVAAAIGDTAQPATAEALQVRAATLGTRAEVTGALWLAAERVPT